MATTPRAKLPSSTISPRKRLLRSPAPNVPLDISAHTNDDDAERQRRREHRIRSPHNLGSPGKIGSGSRTGVVGGTGLTQAQLTDHYASCIKLSSENKINAKNAFGLHLIDCMDEIIRQNGDGGLTNFQMAGCTLDASAKIYSGRVDSIYAETYKVLGGLGGQDHRPNEGEDGAADAADGQRQQGKTRRRMKNSRTIEQNVEALNVKKFDLESGVDPLFSKTSATFDEGGTKGLLLNQLHTSGDTCEVVLDSNAVVIPTNATATTAATSHDPAMTDLSRLRDHLHLLRLGSLQVCPDFADFLFMEEKEGASGSWNVHDVLAATTPSKARSQQEYRYEAGESSDDGGNASFGVPCNEMEDFGDGGVGVVLDGPETDLIDGGDATLAVQSNENNKTMFSMGGQSNGSGSLVLSVAAEHNEYSYFDQQHVANWAGPRHWHLRPRSKTDSTVADGSTAAGPGEKTRERAKRKVFEIDFSASLNTKQLLASSKATVLTKATLTKQTAEQTTLPEDLHFNTDGLLQLFTNPKWKLVRMDVPDEDVGDGGGDMPWYNYKNERDTEGYCLPPGVAAGNTGDEDAGTALLGAGDFGVGGGDADDSLGDNADFAASSMGSMTMDGFGSAADMQMQSFLEQTRGDASMLIGENLVMQPRKVQRIQIDYAKVAKKMDVKKLKSGIWSVLTSPPKQKENIPASIPEEEETVEKALKMDQCEGMHSFSDLYSSLPHKVSSNMTKNLSVPIVFVCLLHLANEKNLTVSSVDSRADLKIGQDGM